MARNQQPEEIRSLRVSNLFGRFNYNLNFSEIDKISIITAPNGYGKTALLRIIDSIFNRKLSFFWKISFDEIQIQFASGKSISILKEIISDSNDEDNAGKKTVSLKSYGFNSNGEEHKLSRNLRSSELRYFERNFPVDQLGPDKWIDYRSEQVFTTDEIIQNYEDQLPEKLFDSLKIPEWLRDAIGCVNAHLVETQRLLYLEEQGERRPPRQRRMTPSSVVEKDATDLAERISQLLQQYANESQKLDQTFPKRILDFRDGEVSGETEIQANLEKLTQKRDDLVSVGLLGSTISDPIKPSEVFQEENIRRILEIYVEDTSQKLSIFDETYKKIRLFKQILDERFSFKTIEFDPHTGISAIDKDNNQAIPLPDLSSGEQHELVLIYELLFKVKEGSIILIDEPELSLHVTWQKHFIADLQKIQQLKKLKVVIATHSPQIIHDKWDLVQELKT